MNSTGSDYKQLKQPDAKFKSSSFPEILTNVVRVKGRILELCWLFSPILKTLKYISACGNNTLF